MQALNAWREKLDALLETIREWLTPLVGEGLVEIKTVPTTIREEMLGHYRTNILVVTFVDGQAIRVKPKARYIIGGDGRVDIELGARTVMLIGQNEAPGWYLVEKEGGRKSNSYPFNKESFENVISSIYTAN